MAGAGAGDEAHRAPRRHELGVLGRVLPAGQRGGARPARRPALRRLPAALGRLRDDRGAAARGPLGRGRRACSPARPRALEAAGAELLVLCTNTMHKVADAITGAIGVPFVHIADTTAERSARAGLDTVGLLATAYTMEQDFYVGRLRDRHGLDVLVPDEADRADRARRDLRRAVRRRGRRRLARGVPADHGRAWPSAAPRASCSAARRSTCWSARTTRRSRCSTPRGCTRGARSSSRSPLTATRACSRRRRPAPSRS